MTHDDRTQLISNLNALRQENEWYRGEVARLNARVTEWANWAEEVKRVDHEKTQQLDQLKNEVAQLSSQVNSAGHRMTDQLYEENQQLKLKSRDLEETLSTALDFLIQKVVEMESSKQRDDAAHFLINSGLAKGLIIGNIVLQPSLSISRDILLQKGVSSAELDRNLHNLQSKGLVQEVGVGVIGIIREEERPASMDTWKDLPVNEAFSAAIRIIQANPREASDVLLNLRDAVANRVGGQVSYALSREASSAKRFTPDPLILKEKLEEIQEQVRFE